MTTAEFTLKPSWYDERGATFSPDRVYRYRWWQEWEDVPRRLLFLMLNPSTADELVVDPTTPGGLDIRLAPTLSKRQIYCRREAKMKPRGKWLWLTATAFVLLSSVGVSPLYAGQKSCWATEALGAGNTCKVTASSTGKCTVVNAFVRFNAGCTICLLSAIRCDLASDSSDLRIDLYTTNTNWTDEQQIGGGLTGITGGSVAIGCDNAGEDAIEVSLVANCT